MPRIHIRAEAWRDLLEISQYTEQRWGPAQADRYTGEIEERWAILEAHPLAGVARPELGAAVRALRAGQHQVYYVIEAGTVIVVRILHAAMDPDRHLSD